MALNITPTNDCNQLSITVTYSNNQATYPLTGTFDVRSVGGASSILNIPIPSFQITSSGGSAQRLVAASDLAISSGVFEVVFQVAGTTVETGYSLFHCDIDCCLAKLTNELIDCACDCERCSKALANAQKVFLLIKAADFALVQASQASAGTQSGYITDANNKYNKAREICDETCGCNC